MTDFSKHFDELDEKGFSIVPNVIDMDQVNRLREQLAIAFEEDNKSYMGLPGKTDDFIVDMVTRGSEFVKLLENEKLHIMLNHFLGPDSILYSYTSTNLRPKDKPVACYMHVENKRYFMPNYHAGIVMTLALDDFTEENGATYYLEGSHKKDFTPTEEEFFSNAVRVCRKAGDAVFFSSRVWHCGGHNSTDETRRAVTLFATRPFFKQRLDYPRLVADHPNVLQHVGEVGRRFLGFDARVPTSLEEFYVPPEERLFKTT